MFTCTLCVLNETVNGAFSSHAYLFFGLIVGETPTCALCQYSLRIALRILILEMQTNRSVEYSELIEHVAYP